MTSSSGKNPLRATGSMDTECYLLQSMAEEEDDPCMREVGEEVGGVEDMRLES